MEAPEGYRLVRVGKRGRIPYIENMSDEQLTKQQKRKLEYRKKNAEKLKEYARNYYAKNMEKIKKQIKENALKKCVANNND